MRVGSLCTGYGGLDLAIGGDPVFVSEIDPHANRVLDQRFPGVPNLGNFTALDELPECDVLTAGFPCQPVSQAGKRAGTDDERWLWDDIERVVGGMGRPPAVLFLENVRGLLSANGGDAMGRVVSGLARLGYVGSYRLVSAADVGACHRRERVFIVARHADGLAWPSGFSFGGRPGEVAQPRPVERAVGSGGGVAAHADSDPRPERHSGPDQPGQPTPRRVAAARSGVFGPYWPAVARWERIIGRPAPDPTIANATSSKRGELDGDDVPTARLNPRFVEWMMGLPDGWVTDTGVSRTAHLKILGNGVVPQQARAAWRMLTP